MELTLVVLAAGLSTRYGGLKQLEPVGPQGEPLLDYAVYDAARAAYSRAVFVIRPALEHAFASHFERTLERLMPVEYTFQQLDDVPGGCSVPRNREKPWGTAHAILATADVVTTPFVAVNADDLYGAGSYRLLRDHLWEHRETDVPVFAMVGFRLDETLSSGGGVSRGICRCDADGFLETVVEVTGIVAEDGHVVGTSATGEPLVLVGDEIASMNMWGFTPAVYPLLRQQFVDFLDVSGPDPEAEFLLSGAVNQIVDQGQARLRVLRARDRWVGITFTGDRARVRRHLRHLVDRGEYPAALVSRKDR